VLLRLALLSALVLLGALALAPSAGAVYGGLGPVGTKVSTGTEGKPGQVNPGGLAHGHAFAVNAATGQFYIGDELSLTVEGKKQTFARVQAFNARGEFLAENRIKMRTREEVPIERVSGLAVDSAAKHVYLLLAEERIENKPKVEKELENLEAKSTATEKAIAKKKEQIAKAKAKGESTGTLEAELAALEKQLKEEEAQEAKLKAEEEPRDAADYAASDLWVFSTEIGGEKLKEQSLLTGSEVLSAGSEEAKASLLFPAGIGVDPKTHDIVIVGQQDQSAKVGTEDVRAALQRVHEDGTLGPRYVDTANCLDQAEPVAEEPACAVGEGAETYAASPVVTTNGRAYVQVGEELWEIPDSTGAGEGFKDVTVTPRNLFHLEGDKVVLKGTEPEEEGGTLSFVPGKEAGEGTLYMRAEFPNAGENGVVELSYRESGGGGKPEAREVGWTGGQEAISPEVKCIVPGGLTQQPLVAGTTAGGVLMLSYSAGRVMSFAAGGEACGHKPSLTPPSVEAGGNPHATEVGIGETTKLSSALTGARALSESWKFRYKDPATGETHEEEEVHSPYRVQTTTTLEHAFKHAGVYEVIESIETDSFAFPTVVAETVKVEAWDIKGALALPEAPVAGESASFKAQIRVHTESPAHLTAVWRFGDGTAPLEEPKEGASPVALTAMHAYATPGSYEVTLTVKDKAGGEVVERAPVVVGASVAEREAKRKAQEEAEAQALKHKQEEEQAAAADKRQQEGEAAAAAKRQQEEEAARQRVLDEKTVHNPEVRIASASISVTPAGALTLTLSCPAGETSCAGTVTLKTLNAVSAAKKSILTLAGGSFTIAGGRVELLNLHLSPKGRKLLARTKSLRALATVVAHDTAVTRTVKTTLTLRLAKPSRKH
jgi:PKD repeat protein